MNKLSSFAFFIFFILTSISLHALIDLVRQDRDELVVRITNPTTAFLTRTDGLTNQAISIDASGKGIIVGFNQGDTVTLEVRANDDQDLIDSEDFLIGNVTGTLEAGEELTWEGERTVVNFEVEFGAKLTIAPGATVIGSRFNSEIEAEGIVTAIGTEANPIIIDNIDIRARTIQDLTERYQLAHLQLINCTLQLPNPQVTGRIFSDPEQSNNASIRALVHNQGPSGVESLTYEDIECDGVSFTVDVARDGNVDAASPNEISINNSTFSGKTLLFIDLRSERLSVTGCTFNDAILTLQDCVSIITISNNDFDTEPGSLRIQDDPDVFIDPEFIAIRDIHNNTAFANLFLETEVTDVFQNEMATITLIGSGISVFNNIITATPGNDRIGLSLLGGFFVPESDLFVGGNTITGHDTGISLRECTETIITQNIVQDCVQSLELTTSGNPESGDFTNVIVYDNLFRSAGVGHFLPNRDCDDEICPVIFAVEPADEPDLLAFPVGFESNETNIAGGATFAGNAWDDFFGEDFDNDGVSEVPNELFREGDVVYMDPFPLSVPIVVNSTGDSADPPEGEITLRSALIQARRFDGPSRIEFNIPGVSPHVITPATQLPSVPGGVTIDGRTDSRIEIDGRLLAEGTSFSPGLQMTGSASRIINLSIYGFPGPGIFVFGGSEHEINDCFIGTNELFETLTGNGQNSSFSNQGSGITVENSDNASILNSTIGNNEGSGILVTGTGRRSSEGVFIANCNIGVAEDGSTVRLLRNTGDGIFINTAGTTHRIGDISGSTRNVISGNLGHGIHLRSPNGQNIQERTEMIGNDIGAIGDRRPGEAGIESDLFGDAFGNGLSGIRLTSVRNCLIGADISRIGGFSEVENVIAFNKDNGVEGRSNFGVPTFGNTVRVNRIFSNGVNSDLDPSAPGLGIDWADSGTTTNDFQDTNAEENNAVNFPAIFFEGLLEASELTDPISLRVFLTAKPDTAYHIDVYQNSERELFGEGANLVARDFLTTDSTGVGEAVIPFGTLGALQFADSFSATASELTSNLLSARGTSEFGPSLSLLQFLAPADDVDGDNLPNDFEQLHFGSPIAANPNDDSDGDGETNLQEFQFGTDPTDRNDNLNLNVTRNGNTTDITFNSKEGLLYQLQSSEDLENFETIVGPNAIESIFGNGETITITIRNDALREFYRLLGGVLQQELQAIGPPLVPIE